MAAVHRLRDQQQGMGNVNGQKSPETGRNRNLIVSRRCLIPLWEVAPSREGWSRQLIFFLISSEVL